MGLKWLLFLIGPLDLIGIWFREDQRANITKTRVSRDWVTSSNINNYHILNSEHNWEDLDIQLRNQETCTSNNHNQIMEAQFSI